MITPKCKLTYAVNPSGRKSTAMITKPISIAVNTTLTFLAVGFGDTSVFTFCGDLQRDRSPRFRSLRDGAATLGEGQLVGLVVATVQGNRTAVFVVTDKALTSYVLDSNGTLLRTV
jgi:hypothetical protein